MKEFCIQATSLNKIKNNLFVATAETKSTNHVLPVAYPGF
jgi:hypothetical protein